MPDLELLRMVAVQGWVVIQAG